MLSVAGEHDDHAGGTMDDDGHIYTPHSTIHSGLLCHSPN